MVLQEDPAEVLHRVFGHEAFRGRQEEIVRHAKARQDVWFATHAEVAAWAKEHACAQQCHCGLDITYSEKLKTVM